MKQRNGRRNGVARGRNNATKGQVENLAIQVEKQKGEIARLKGTKNTKATNTRRNRKVNRGSLVRSSSISRSLLGNGNSQMDPLSTYTRKRGSYNRMWNDYLNHILDPTLKDAFIPDELLLPYTCVQVRTTGEVTSSSDGAFTLFITPEPSSTGYCEDGTSSPTTSAIITVNGTDYGQTATAGNAFPSTISDALATNAFAWRPVSMGVYCTYTGAPLDASGRLASACYPNADEDELLALGYSYTELANYNYSFQCKSLSGVTQIWFPGGPISRKLYKFNIENPPDFEAFPTVIIASDSLPATTKVFNIEIIQNYEIFSTSQILTAPKSRISNRMKIDHANSVASHLIAKNGGAHAGGSARDHIPWWKTALEVGEGISKIAAPIIDAFIPG
jgi:hypothetical protein